MNMQRKQLLISAISAAIIQKINSGGSYEVMTSVEPYKGDNGLVSIAGLATLCAPIKPVEGFDANHADIAVEFVFHNCYFNQEAREYVGSLSDYELRYGSAYRNVIFANCEEKPTIHDWRYEGSKQLSYDEEVEISKAVFEQVLTSADKRHKDALIESAFEALKKYSPVPFSA